MARRTVRLAASAAAPGPEDCKDYPARHLTCESHPLIGARVRTVIARRSQGLPPCLDLAVMRFLETRAGGRGAPEVVKYLRGRLLGGLTCLSADAGDGQCGRPVVLDGGAGGGEGDGALADCVLQLGLDTVLAGGGVRAGVRLGPQVLRVPR